MKLNNYATASLQSNVVWWHGCTHGTGDAESVRQCRTILGQPWTSSYTNSLHKQVRHCNGLVLFFQLLPLYHKKCKVWSLFIYHFIMEYLQYDDHIARFFILYTLYLSPFVVGFVHHFAQLYPNCSRDPRNFLHSIFSSSGNFFHCCQNVLRKML